MDKLDTVVIHTDGGCEPNPGNGGWAAVLAYRGHYKELSGCEANSTNNRMELTAAIKALEALKRPSIVELHTDSEYVKKGISEWMFKWQRNDWRTRSGEVKNRDLWERLYELSQKHRIEWKWLKGHAGHEHNERCDALAGAAIRRLRVDS